MGARSKSKLSPYSVAGANRNRGAGSTDRVIYRYMRSPSIGVRQVEVEADDAGQRLDNFLMRHLKGVPRSAVYRLLRTGQVRQVLCQGWRRSIIPRRHIGDARCAAANRDAAAPAAHLILFTDHGLEDAGGFD
jgi:hypothetical protein